MALLGGAGLLALIGLVNVASLLLVRAGSRKREIAVRGALGASRARLVRQFAVEGFLLAGAGCGIGLLLTLCAIGILARQVPGEHALLARAPFQCASLLLCSLPFDHRGHSFFDRACAATLLIGFA
jgi:ABC-type antimicrobial peptide transport system permease subunit